MLKPPALIASGTALTSTGLLAATQSPAVVAIVLVAELAGIVIWGLLQVRLQAQGLREAARLVRALRSANLSVTVAKGDVEIRPVTPGETPSACPVRRPQRRRGRSRRRPLA